MSGERGRRMSRWLKRLLLAVYIPLGANIPMVLFWLWSEMEKGGIGSGIRAGVLLVAGGFTWLVWMAWNILPIRKGVWASWRVTVMEGGRSLVYGALYGFCFQAAAGVLGFLGPDLLGEFGFEFPEWVSWAGYLYGWVMMFVLLWNGILRIFFTSRRLRLRTRLLMLLAMWIPLVNLVVLLYALRLVHEEYDFECCKASMRHVRAQSDLCCTRYPLLMVHGVGFRDLRWFNYWGRIPRELMRYGASVYYGHQEAFGTAAANGEDIARKIREICRETGCEKVNIIAHSKGGLDSRYAISALEAAPWVASLTTVCTPHRGCRFVDYACRLPEGLYRAVARHFDRAFKRMGDSHPDFYTATRQFSTYYSEEFNRKIKDVPGVYYQSCSSLMRDWLSDPLLWIPYLIIRLVDGPSDGLVTPDSARWGNDLGIITNRYHRGISHGDMIDLKREDYKGFDVVEFYVSVVKELKEKGF